MTSHPPSHRLLMYAESNVDSEVAAHVARCERCQRRVADVRSLSRIVQTSLAPATPGALPVRFSPDHERSLDRFLETTLTQRPVARTRRRRWLRPLAILLPLTAAAAIFLVARPNVPPLAPRARLVGVARFDAPHGSTRGQESDRLHFELRMPRRAWLVILRVAPSGVEWLLPHPNPVFGFFGQEEPFPEGSEVRVPPVALADYDGPLAAPGATFLATALDARPSEAKLSQVRAECQLLISQGASAIRERLQDRLGETVELPSR